MNTCKECIHFDACLNILKELTGFELPEDYTGNAGSCDFHLPTNDVVEVVRCKDCKHQPNLKTGTKGMMWCRKFRNEVTAIDFCSYGEKKKEAEI